LHGNTFLLRSIILNMLTNNNNQCNRLEVVTGQHKSNLMYTYIQTIGVVSQAAGVRVGKFLPAIIPKLQGFCNIDTYDT
jgi:hypothetical protein